MGTKLLSVIILYLTVIACTEHFKKALTYNYPNQPKETQYRLSKKKFVFNSLVDTSSIYLRASEYSGNDQLSNVFNFIRFSNNGIAFYSYDYESFPSVADFDKMPDGQYCRYVVNGKKLKLEFYNHTLNRFDYWIGEITDSSVEFKNFKARNWSKSRGKVEAEYFKRLPIKLHSQIKFPG